MRAPCLWIGGEEHSPDVVLPFDLPTRVAWGLAQPPDTLETKPYPLAKICGGALLPSLRTQSHS